MHKTTLALVLGLLLCACGEKPAPGGENNEDIQLPSEIVDEFSDKIDPLSWTFVSPEGGLFSFEDSSYPDANSRKDKFVGIFYFLWHGCHGYDSGANNNQVVAPSGDSRSPYNIPDILAANPGDSAWGPQGAMHHWGEPYLGYYVSNDNWVIRKHAQMLGDAGVDVIFFDVTNGFHYLPVVKNLCDVFMQVRAAGGTTPQVAFLLNAQTKNVLKTLYNEFYSKNLYSDLWFLWEGKPLILADIAQAPDNVKNFFTFRQSWYLYNIPSIDTWFGNGEDKWPWGGFYPQQAGTHGGQNECVAVLPATHPTSNIGRSHDALNDTQPLELASGEGRFFKAQFSRAKALDPSLIFFTGWNEWTAQRQIATSSSQVQMLGQWVPKGGTYFVDQYNHEFSRDIEPLKGDFGDAYYYMMVDFIRQFKGARKAPADHYLYPIKIDGNFDDWKRVVARYADDRGDILRRSHYGWGKTGTLVNTTGRNDILRSKVACDGKNLYFMASTASNITSPVSLTGDSGQWMQLFISTGKSSESWEGFDFVLNRNLSGQGRTALERCIGGWSWETIANVEYAVNGKNIEICVPLHFLGISDTKNITIDFKWIDNAASSGDIQTCMRDGDSAPNGRFRYRYNLQRK